ncbi:MAG: DNA recombination protein [Candidatus Scalindua rubra]|uniref:DNA recombination protein n=1 Tax=Candidatus Scalindua rubra TaxID=1872076 RepID=A0A1E3X9Y1_9BACT|nr:MAG: DNA recombination protein [Candidatus Scalindua rubra]
MNTILIIICIALSVGIGLLIGFILASRKSREKDQRVVELQTQVQGSEKVINEIRQQVDNKDEIIEKMRREISSVEQAKTSAETKLEEAVKNVEEQKKLLEKAEEKLTTTFQALSGESLKSNNKAFIELAKETLEAVLSKAKGEFGEKEESVKNIVNSLNEALKRYEQQVSELEKKRASDYGSLESQIKTLVLTNQQLQKETGNLVTALRRPEVRGRWGEVTLKRVVELSGMSEHCDFTEQVSVTTEDGRLRPDMIVHLPASREIIVDSKVSLDAFIDATAVTDEEQRKTLIVKHSQHVRNHMKALTNKKYWDQFSKAPEFVVMFIPGESFLSAALSVDHTLIEDGMENKVIISTPTTLIALLRAVAFGWRQEQIAKHAQEIATLGKEIYDRFEPFLGHINKTGNYLSQATVSFNKMLMSLERRVMVSVRKFKELGAAGDKELPEAQPIEQIPMKAQLQDNEKDGDNKEEDQKVDL